MNFRSAAVELRFERANAAPFSLLDVQSGDGDGAVYRSRVQSGLRGFRNLERDSPIGAFKPQRAAHLGHSYVHGRIHARRVDGSPHGAELDSAVYHHRFHVRA